MLRREFTDPSYDTDDWEPIAVPSHWRSTAAFADADGPLLYHTTFEQHGPSGASRSWLTFDGLFYQGDVWLDGAYLGDTEGYFLPHTFEISEQLAERSEHTLAVEVTCAPQTDRTAKRPGANTRLAATASLQAPWRTSPSRAGERPARRTPTALQSKRAKTPTHSRLGKNLRTLLETTFARHQAACRGKGQETNRFEICNISTRIP